MENDQNHKVTCDSVKVTTLFCLPYGAGAERLLSEGTVSRNGPGTVQSRGAVGFEPPWQCHCSIPGPVLGAEALPAPFSLHAQGLPCSPCPGATLSSGRGFGSVYHSCQGGEFLVTLLQLRIPERPAKGGVGRLIGVLFPACDCWSSRGEIKSSSPAAAQIPGLIFIS